MTGFGIASILLGHKWTLEKEGLSEEKHARACCIGNAIHTSNARYRKEACWWMQALAWRQWLMKRRGWVTTLVEILSPIILVSMLVRLSAPRLHVPPMLRCCYIPIVLSIAAALYALVVPCFAALHMRDKFKMEDDMEASMQYSRDTYTVYEPRRLESSKAL